MPSRIRVLDEITINKIAAGEVIENPSSVVKELVENALDAGATEITVEIKGGGRQLIRISDNGCGMNRDDALLSLERHATSKLRDIEGLHTLDTMGFRGEAVPAIASISKLTLLTCAEGEEEGTLVIVEGGKILQCGAAARSQGTTFEVKSLFFNVPVRKKFQRSPAYDSSEILKIVSIQALAHPQVKFHLISNQETSLLAKHVKKEAHIEKLGERISDVLGADYFAGLIPMEREYKGIMLSGYISIPSNTKPNRTGQYLFINRRAVTSPLVSFAIREAYGTALPSSRHPQFVLFLSMDSALVDVNVHPQKREVRLRHDHQLKEIITMSVEEALNKTEKDLFPEWSSLPEPQITFSKPQFTPRPAYEPFRNIAEVRNVPTHYQEHYQPSIIPVEKTVPAPSLFPIEKPQTPVQPQAKVVASLPGYFILASDLGAVYLLDQRAAHSRILYEQLLAGERNAKTLPQQHLLIPYTIDLPPQEAAVLMEHRESFQNLGIQIESFGNNSFIVNGIPQIFGEADIKEIISDILCDLMDLEKESVVKTELQKRISHAAGRAAISHRKKLSLPEGQSLYAQLLKCSSPMHCPSGKPVMIELNAEGIAKQFQK